MQNLQRRKLWNGRKLLQNKDYDETGLEFVVRQFWEINFHPRDESIMRNKANRGFFRANWESIHFAENGGGFLANEWQDIQRLRVLFDYLYISVQSRVIRFHL